MFDKDELFDSAIKGLIFALIYFIPLLIWGTPKWWAFPSLFLMGTACIMCLKARNKLYDP